MIHHIFEANPSNQYDIAILVKSTGFLPTDLEHYFAIPLANQGIARDSMIAFDLQYSMKNKATVKLIKEYLNNDLLKALESLQVTTLLCADPNYFKVLTGVRKTAGCAGYVYPCKIKGYEHMEVILSPNPQSLFHDPTNQTNITYAVNTVANHVKGQHVNFGTNIIHNQIYPDTLAGIEHYLTVLLDYPELTCDIETESLLFTSKIGTIAFAWDQHNGIAFAVEKDNTEEEAKKVKQLLKKFFELYKGKLIYHNATFDIKFLIYHLWMCKV